MSMSQNIKDRERDKFVETSTGETAVRTILDSLNESVPSNWGGFTLTYNSDNQLETALFYEDAAKTTLITTITLSYTDGNLTGGTSVDA